jgi:hypothetical protein
MASQASHPASAGGNTAQAAAGVARKAGEQLKREGAHVLDQEKSAAAHEVEKIGKALHSAAERLRESDSALAAWAQSTAETVDQASNNLANRDVGELLSTSQTYARKHPGVVIGGMFLAGLTLSRFFRASSPESGETGEEPAGTTTHTTASPYGTEGVMP